MRTILPGILLMYSAYTDIRRREIDIIPVFVFAVLGFGCMSFGYKVSVYSSLAGAMLGLFLVWLSILSKGVLGLGDGVLFIVLGLYLGHEKSVELLLLSLLLSAIYSVVVLIRERNINKEYPFVPFILAAYLMIFMK